ncbi:hypothetical protein GV828_10045 [Flavobacterium sp. NST-5]|uniref:Membrane or secreted protein n=1 Tax=Flavobacterium ichthyis TaxID=2698827 RepID=A0ABW9Z9H6_9FLAO|nr:hypothetical protein [Flavobacterium ichthyis]NBL65541.1 hypothetical protein [Flavobacterium ichthyis]
MKKNLVLFALFILPIVAYLFFASGINTFAKLPTITNSIPDINQWKNAEGKSLTLNDKITILGFTGTEIEKNQGNYFNLNQKIYNKNKDFKDFQFMMIAPEGTQDQVKSLLEKLKPIADNQDISKWNFVFAPESEIRDYFAKLKLVGGLDQTAGTSNVYIVDKKRNLRGRKGENLEGKNEYKEGYNTISAADLHNEMSDDVKIILYEYRAALKKNNPKMKRKI